MFREHLHHSTVLCKGIIVSICFRHPLLICSFKYGTQTIRGSLIRSKDAKVASGLIAPDDVAEKRSENSSVRRHDRTTLRILDSVVREVGKDERFDNWIGDLVVSHPKMPWRHKSFQLWLESTIRPEQVLRFVTPVFGMRRQQVSDWDLLSMYNEQILTATIQSGSSSVLGSQLGSSLEPDETGKSLQSSVRQRTWAQSILLVFA